MIPQVFPLYPKAGTVGPETIATLLSGRRFRLEHIVSNAVASPDGFWYDQPESEWVALIQGTAKLEFPDGSLHLKAGDCLLIGRHQRHRVTATSADAVWIALHFDDEERPAEPQASGDLF